MYTRPHTKIFIQIKHLLYLLLVSSPLIAQTEAKVNLATIPFLIPNFGLEVPLKSEKQSLQFDALGSFLGRTTLLDDTPFHVNQSFRIPMVS